MSPHESLPLLPEELPVLPDDPPLLLLPEELPVLPDDPPLPLLAEELCVLPDEPPLLLPDEFPSATGASVCPIVPASPVLGSGGFAAQATSQKHPPDHRSDNRSRGNVEREVSDIPFLHCRSVTTLRRSRRFAFQVSTTLRQCRRRAVKRAPRCLERHQQASCHDRPLRLGRARSAETSRISVRARTNTARQFSFS
jgi:hypothetical protein